MAIKDFHRATLNAGQRRVKHPAMAFFPGKFECNRLNLNYLFYLGQRNDFAGLILLNCDYVEGDLADSAIREDLNAGNVDRAENAQTMRQRLLHLSTLTCTGIADDSIGLRTAVSSYFAFDLSLRECPQVRDRLWDNAL